METSAKELEYTRLKNSLQALGFTQYLGADSVSLVQNILDNLIKATKSFKNLNFVIPNFFPNSSPFSNFQ